LGGLGSLVFGYRSGSVAGVHGLSWEFRYSQAGRRSMEAGCFRAAFWVLRWLGGGGVCGRVVGVGFCHLPGESTVWCFTAEDPRKPCSVRYAGLRPIEVSAVPLRCSKPMAPPRNIGRFGRWGGFSLVWGAASGWCRLVGCSPAHWHYALFPIGGGPGSGGFLV